MLGRNHDVLIALAAACTATLIHWLRWIPISESNAEMVRIFVPLVAASSVLIGMHLVPKHARASTTRFAIPFLLVCCFFLIYLYSGVNSIAVYGRDIIYVCVFSVSAFLIGVVAGPIRSNAPDDHPRTEGFRMGADLRIPTPSERRATMDKKHVFISYCHDNAAEVRHLRDQLIAAGEGVWWDGDIKGGQDWKYEIRTAMGAAYAVVLCLSEESDARITSGVYPEIADAISAYREYAPGNVFLIPVRLSECGIPSIEIDGTRTLDRLQYIDLYPRSLYTANVQKLLESIRQAPFHP